MDKFNSEGYADLTAYEALMKIEQEERAARKAANFRPLVYICSPYSGNTEFNANNARIYSRFAVAKGAIPLAPHLLFPQFMSEGTRTQPCPYYGERAFGKMQRSLGVRRYNVGRYEN